MHENNNEQRDQYFYWVDIPTRWMDGDPYGHVNNVEYYSFIDTAVTRMLLEKKILRNPNFRAVGLCVESQCRYYAPISFPETIEAGVRIARVGNSSLRYEVGLFKSGEHKPAAAGYFVHVFVDPDNHRPVSLSAQIRQQIQAVTVPA
ncbi:acyl-CoA thioesterase [Halopseudomonas xiamenensis]|uniref:acyl-CoA thioesterase n=1 Tax=Halopseudomonas xiamenensis TaxID=157792 RepID=UPI0016270E3B|nr:thioesterase family protein [Halopseudomonas xiamenensis]